MSPALLMLTMTMSHCRYMKCLTIGMNPNYVLSEDEKKKRFRRKNNSGGGTDEENVKSPAVAVVTGGFNTGMRIVQAREHMTRTIQRIIICVGLLS